MFHTTFQERGYCSRAGSARLDTLLRSLCPLDNAALEERLEADRTAGTSMSLYAQLKRLPQIRREDPEGWGNQEVQAGRGVLRRLDRALHAFFRRVKAGESPGVPRFKPWQRFPCLASAVPRPGMVHRRGQHWIVKLKGCPVVKRRPARPLPASQQLKALRIVRRPAGCTVDLVYAVEQLPLPASRAAGGIDMGVRQRLTLSTGETIERAEPDHEAVAQQQRRVSRCRKGSKTRRRQGRQLARLRRRQHVRNRKAGHRLTTALLQRFGRIAVKQLPVPPLPRSAQGTGEEPGPPVAQQNGRNPALPAQTWGGLRHQLTYKAAGAGRQLVAVHPPYTSQTCSRCGARPALGRSERYQWPACGRRMDRDGNAALTILRAGNRARAARQNGMLGALSI